MIQYKEITLTPQQYEQLKQDQEKLHEIINRHFIRYRRYSSFYDNGEEWFYYGNRRAIYEVASLKNELQKVKRQNERLLKIISHIKRRKWWQF